MKTALQLFVPATILLFSASLVEGQVQMSAGTYIQSFDSLSTNGTSNPWTDNSTLLGWYGQQQNVGAPPITIYRAESGTGNAGALYSFGAAAATERALGSIASSTSGNIAF